YVRELTSSKTFPQSNLILPWLGIQPRNQSATAGPTATPQIGASLFAPATRPEMRLSELTLGIWPSRASSMDVSAVREPNTPRESCSTTTQVPVNPASRQ